MAELDSDPGGPVSGASAVQGFVPASEQGIAPVDWLGQPIDCSRCDHAATLLGHTCRVGYSCVHDRYAKRIERFFGTNPGQARHYLDHPYFEVRANAVRFVDVFQLPRLIHDPDETVRAMVALRVPQRMLVALRADPEREVRVRVAHRLDLDALKPMMRDEDYFVRTVVAKRLPDALLYLMMRDTEVEVRCEVARRIDARWLQELIHDDEPAVRRIVLQRLPDERIAGLRFDDDVLIRHEVAQRVPIRYLNDMVGDTDELVRDVVIARIKASVAQRGAADVGQPGDASDAMPATPVADPDPVSMTGRTEDDASPRDPAEPATRTPARVVSLFPVAGARADRHEP